MGRPRRWLVVLVGLALIVSGAAACDDDDAAQDSAAVRSCRGCPVFGEGDAPRVDVGERFVIALASTPSTGYRWTITSIGDDSVVRAASDSYVAGADRPGASGEQRFELRATKRGTTTVTLRYARSFEPTDPSARVVELTVTVR